VAVSDVDGLVSGARHDRKPRPKHPTGYEPGALLDENGEGFIIPTPRPLDGVARPDNEPWDDHVRKAGLDPLLVEVVPPIEVRTWDAAIGAGQVQTMVYFKARIRARQSKTVDPELMAWILKWKPTKPKDSIEVDATFVVAWSDWQIGKGDGDGTDGTIRRILDGFDQTVDALKRSGTNRVLVASLGDLLEGCSGHYAQQTFRTDRTLRDQENTVRRLAVAGIKVLADAAVDVVVMPVGGNHGEVRQDGKSFTDFSDNFDVGVYEPIIDQLTENPRFDHVSFHVPRADLTQTIDLHGTIVGLFHGHQAKRGASVPQKVDNWLAGQMKSRHPVGDADILLNGHYHFLIVRHTGPRTHIQVPAVDGGSEWFDNTMGGGEPAGTVVFTVDADGWDNLKLIPAVRG
jgi:hypothetical protein